MTTRVQKYDANHHFMTTKVFFMTSELCCMTLASARRPPCFAWSADITLPFTQTIQEAADVWMRTAGKVLCRPALCRNFGCKTIKETLFYRDPNYQHKTDVPKHLSKNLTPFSEIVTTDWGKKASHKRDTDGEKIIVMLRELLQGQLANMPMLFSAGCQKFTTPEITSCLGFSTMSENARRWFDAGWLQLQVKDGMSHLTDTEAAVLAGKDRLADNEDYAPYGRTEKQEDEPAAGMPRAESSGSTPTVSDDGPLESPSLGTPCFFCLLCAQQEEGGVR